jgi:3-hydroxyisobutyrate dehydrogenase-like beta-hydroxyacid dehydrogenase
MDRIENVGMLMVSNLTKAGLAIVAYGRDSERIDIATSGGAAGAHRIEDVIEGVDVVVSMIPNDTMLQDHSHGEL